MSEEQDRHVSGFPLVGGLEEGLPLPISQNVGKSRLTKILSLPRTLPSTDSRVSSHKYFSPHTFLLILWCPLIVSFVNKFGVKQGDDALLESDGEFSEKLRLDLKGRYRPSSPTMFLETFNFYIIFDK